MSHTIPACEVCRSTAVQWTSWVDAFGLVSDEGPDESTYCPDCGTQDGGVDWSPAEEASVGALDWVSRLPEAGTIRDRRAQLAAIDAEIAAHLDAAQALRVQREAVIRAAGEYAADHWTLAEIAAAIGDTHRAAGGNVPRLEGAPLT